MTDELCPCGHADSLHWTMSGACMECRQCPVKRLKQPSDRPQPWYVDPLTGQDTGKWRQDPLTGKWWR